MVTVQHPRVLLQQRDFHAILVIALLDVGLGLTGITTGQAGGNPLYADFASSAGLLTVGAVLYLGVLAAASTVLTGTPRDILASIVFGIHVAGVATGIKLLFPYIGGSLSLTLFAVVAAAGTALFYHTETTAHT